MSGERLPPEGQLMRHCELPLDSLVRSGVARALFALLLGRRRKGDLQCFLGRLRVGTTRAPARQ